MNISFLLVFILTTYITPLSSSVINYTQLFTNYIQLFIYYP